MTIDEQHQGSMPLDARTDSKPSYGPRVRAFIAKLKEFFADEIKRDNWRVKPHPYGRLSEEDAADLESGHIPFIFMERTTAKYRVFIGIRLGEEADFVRLAVNVFPVEDPAEGHLQSATLVLRIQALPYRRIGAVVRRSLNTVSAFGCKAAKPWAPVSDFPGFRELPTVEVGEHKGEEAEDSEEVLPWAPDAFDGDHVQLTPFVHKHAVEVPDPETRVTVTQKARDWRKARGRGPWGRK